MRTLAVLSLWLLAAGAWAEDSAAQCGRHSDVALQVLGSGGPIADDARASTSYLIWIDGEARIMIDAGTGSFLRFGQSGASFDTIDFVGLSHFHSDHVADFVGLLKSGMFSSREGELVVAGPVGVGPFPGLRKFLERQFAAGDGAYGYLGRYLEDGPVRIVAEEVDGERAVEVFQGGDIRVTAKSVPHGIVPALAFRISVGDRSVVFASDQNGSDETFAAFARGADLLVMHLVIPENAGPRARSLHATPSQIAEIARDARPGQLVLSHFMARSLRTLDQSKTIIENGAGLRPFLASDLLCIPVTGSN